MPLATDKIVYLHIPKTGGIWVKHMLNSLNLNPIEIGQQHEHFPGIYKHFDKSFYQKRLVFTMVRHPLYWYQSRWAFRVKNGWHINHPLDWECASNDFHKFVDNMLNRFPNGWCNWEFDRYINGDSGMVKYVGRTENIVDDFIEVMDMAGYDVDKKFILNSKPANTSDMGGQKSSYWAKYTQELYDRVMQVESTVINRYYHDFVIDPNDLIGPRPY